MTEKFSIAEIIEATNKLSDNSVELKKKVKIAIDPQTEKIILEAEEHLNKSLKEDDVYMLIDENVSELKEETPYLIDKKVEKTKKFGSENLKNISRGFKNINKICKILKEKNLELEIDIKDYQKGDMFVKQEKQIKILKKDIQILRDNVTKLKINESKLKTEVVNLNLDAKISVEKNNKMTATSKKFEDKIKFYSEENARITIEKHEITKKFKNSQSHLFALEKDKRMIEDAVNNLNTLLSNSNVDTQTFKNEIIDSSKINKNIKKFKNKVD